MCVTAFRKEWRRFRSQLVFGIACWVLLVAAEQLYERYDDARYYRGLFSVYTRLGSPLFTFHSERAFNGDGYSIRVYSLPQAVRDRFENFDRAAMANFPKRPDERSRWNVAAWHQTPALTVDIPYVEFALAMENGQNAPQHAAIRQVLGRKGSFIAYFYKQPGEHLANVDLFVVDLVEGRVFLVNLNT